MRCANSGVKYPCVSTREVGMRFFAFLISFMCSLGFTYSFAQEDAPPNAFEGTSILWVDLENSFDPYSPQTNQGVLTFYGDVARALYERIEKKYSDPEETIGRHHHAEGQNISCTKSPIPGSAWSYFCRIGVSNLADGVLDFNSDY